MNGKSICKELKEIRRSIAKENDINIEIAECTFKGNCSGTCPRCEMEARQLENELSRRLSLGKVATVAGIALTLAGIATAATVKPQQPEHNPLPECGWMMNEHGNITDAHLSGEDENYAFTVVVKKEETGEPFPYVNVLVMKDGKFVATAMTDTNGVAIINGLRDEAYEVKVGFVGYYTYTVRDRKPLPYNDLRIEDSAIKVKMVKSKGPILGSIYEVETSHNDPLIDVSSGNNTMQNMEIEGVKVKVKY